MPKLGKLPFVADDRDLKLEVFVDRTAMPKPPEDFGHYDDIAESALGMLGNDRVGDCVFAGAAHETMILGREGGHRPTFTDESVLSDYSAVTGYVEGDESTDRGTEVRAAMKYRKSTGILDAHSKRHHIGAYLQIKPKDIDQIVQAAYVFGVVGIGIEFPSSAMTQFSESKPWSVVAGAQIEGGHYVPIVGRKDGDLLCVTWGKVQPMTTEFLTTYTDEAWVFVSASVLDGSGASPEGLSIESLRSALGQIAHD